MSDPRERCGGCTGDHTLEQHDRRSEYLKRDNTCNECSCSGWIPEGSFRFEVEGPYDPISEGHPSITLILHADRSVTWDPWR